MLKKNNVVLTISLILSTLFVLVGVIFNDWLGAKASEFLDFAVTYFNWFYLLVATLFVAFCLFLMFSKFGDVRLGRDNEPPEFSTFSWMSMLFSAGMGVGLVFWSVAEPVSHYTNPPLGEGFTGESASDAMTFTFFHWGLHPWSIFAIVALSLAYFHFRKGFPSAISSIFHPLLGKRIYGTPGKIIDIGAVFITAVGVASTFGLSTLQITSGMNAQWDVPNTFTTQLIVIGIATLLFMVSSWTGLKRGIKYLSYVNILIMFLFIFIIIFMGPAKQIFEMLILSTGNYLNNILSMSLRVEPFNSEASSWIGNWTVFYWAWWTTWAPFVGSFIARISKGRTIREFIVGVLLIPSIVSFLWFSAMGGSAIRFIHELGNVQLAEVINANTEGALFAFLNTMPFSTFLSIVVIILIFSFFITSADSATFVLGMLSTNGEVNPSRGIKITWGLITAGSATVFLLSGGVDAVRTISILVASPFTIISIFMIWSVFKALREDINTKIYSRKTILRRKPQKTEDF